MGKLSVTGETMIFRKDREGRNGTFPTYATTISSRNEDGSYSNRYKEVKFRKDVEVANKTIINIDDGFLTFREYMAAGGEKQAAEYIMVLEFTEVQPPGDAPSGFTSLSDEDIPF